MWLEHKKARGGRGWLLAEQKLEQDRQEGRWGTRRMQMYRHSAGTQWPCWHGGCHCFWSPWRRCWSILDLLIQAKSLTLCSSERGLECFSTTLKALAFAGAVYLLLALILSKELGTPTNLWVSTHITNNGLIHLVLTSIAFAFFKKAAGCSCTLSKDRDGKYISVMVKMALSTQRDS